MGNQIALTFIFLIAIICVLVFTELIYRRFGLKGEMTRKFAHFTATLSTTTFPYIFTSHWYVLALASFFFVILFISRNGTQLKSIHDIERKSIGSYLLPLSIYITFLISHLLGSNIMFVLPMLVLAICDPMAGILGLNIKRNNRNIQIFGHKLHKTWLGSGSFLVSCFIICVITLYFNTMDFDLKTFWLALGIAVVSTLVELFSWRGTDNLLVPMSVLVMLLLFL
jgi:dolichol kinase